MIADKDFVYSQQPDVCFETDGHKKTCGKDEVVVKICYAITIVSGTRL